MAFVESKEKKKYHAGGEPEPPADAAEVSAIEEHGHEHSHASEESLNPACKREVSVEIPVDVVSRAVDQTIKKYQKVARIPGFRAGKVPTSIIRNRFIGDIRSEVADELIPKHFRAEVQKSGLLPVSQPQVTDMHFKEGEPLKFKAVFEVLPEFEVRGYKDLKADKKDVSVSEDEVTEALKTLQERQAAYDAVEDRELRDGDFAQISFTGTSKGTKAIAEKKAEIAEQKTETSPVQEAIDKKVEEEIAKPVKVDEVLVEIGGKNTVKDFSDNLRGVRPGEERNFDVTYPEDFSDQRLAGQVMSYAVKVQAVKKKNMPELSDGFAKELGEFPTLEDLKTRIRENIEAERKHEIEHKGKDKLVDELIAKNDFPVPQALVDRQIDLRLERGFRALAAQGMPAGDMRKMNFERLRAGQKEAAVREVKASLLLDKIAEMEGIDASDDDIQREIEIAATQSQQPVEALRQRLSKDGSLERLKDRIRNEKALDFLYSQSA